MAFVVKDRVQETTTTTGTGTYTLAGAVTGYQSFSVIGNANTTYYAVADGTNWEVGVGTYTAAGTTLSRDTILASSNAGAAVNWGAGTKQAFVTYPAGKAAYFDNTHALHIPTATAEPPTPVGGVELYASEIVPGNTVLKVMRPSGVDSPIQDGIAFNRLVKCVPAAGAVATFGAANFTFAGTVSQPTPVLNGGSALGQIPRVQYASAATANAVTTHISTGNTHAVFRGTAAGEGGFRYLVRFGLSGLAALGNFFVGISDTATAAAATSPNPLTSTTPGKIGLAFVGSTGTLKIVHNVTGTTPTQIDLGANFPVDTTSLYELILFCRPFSTAAENITYRVRRYTTDPRSPAFEQTGTISTNIPTGSTILYPWGYYGNGGTAAAVSWRFNQLALESDW